MSFSQAQLDALDAAIASGTLRVSYDGKEITYRSMDELMRVRSLAVNNLGTARQTHSNPSYGRGT